MSDQRQPDIASTVIPVIDPFTDPALFDGVLWRRSFAYLVDLVVLLGLLFLYKILLVALTIVTFGLATPLLILIAAAVPVAYHTLTIGGPGSATLGMRLFGLQVRIWNGGNPGYIQALLHTAVFYVTTSFSGGLILLWPLFSNRRRCL
ncbi:MAG: RDD family protein, partial [Ferrovibrio sp.]